MTEETDRDLVKRAEAALSGLPLGEPDWEGLAKRIEGAVQAAPPENAELFEAPLPATLDEGTETGPAISIGPESTEEVDDAWASAPEAASPAEAPDAAGAVAAAPVVEEPVAAVAVAAPAVEEPEEIDAASEPAAAEEPEEIDAASEPAAADEPPPSPRQGVSLADLARSSVARRGSEAASIAKESLALASQSRAQGEQIAQRVQAAQPPTSVPPPSLQAQRERNRDRGPWVGVAIAGIGLAAGFGLYLRGQHGDAQPVAVTAPEREQPRAVEPAAAPAPRAKTEAPTPEPLLAPEAKLEPSTLESLGREPARAEPKSGSAAKAVTPSPAPAPAPAAGGSGKVVAEKIVLDEEQKPEPKTPPSAGAPRPGDAKLRPAELSSSTTMTDRPSAGAAQAAVGAVLGAARACVAGHPQPSSAQLVFASDGQVQSVTVGGPAAGTPAAACIESALKKARVQPFAASSFSLGVTVRPP